MPEKVPRVDLPLESNSKVEHIHKSILKYCQEGRMAKNTCPSKRINGTELIRLDIVTFDEDAHQNDGTFDHVILFRN